MRGNPADFELREALDDPQMWEFAPTLVRQVMRHQLLSLIVGLAVVALIVAGCGGSDDEASDGGALSSKVRPTAEASVNPTAEPVASARDSNVPVPGASGQSLYYFPPESGPWESVDPASVGWDAEKLSEALDVAGDRHSSGVVILHNGRILAERHWTLSDPSQAYKYYRQGVAGVDSHGHAIEDVTSVQKSVTAVLVGIAQERGLLHLDDPVSKHLGAGWSQAAPQQEEAITLRHLLSMTSGLAKDMSFEADAGSMWRYNTFAYHSVMRVIEAVTGQDRNAITLEWLTSKLGMKASFWTPRPGADPTIAWGFSTTARELARFGLMIQAGGRWGDQVIIEDSEYLQEMRNSSQPLHPAYGYLWWLNGQEFLLGVDDEVTRQEGSLFPSAPDDLVAAEGVLARRLYIVPSLGLVITRLGDNGRIGDGVSFDEAFWQSLMDARN